MKSLIYFFLFVNIVANPYLDGICQSPVKAHVKNAEIAMEGQFQPGQLSKNGKFYYFIRPSQNKAKGACIHSVEISPDAKLSYRKDTLSISNVGSHLLRFGSLTLSGNLRYGVFVASKSSLWQGNELYYMVKDAHGYKVSAPLRALKESRIASACPWISNDGKHLYFIKENRVYHSYRSKSQSNFVAMELLQIDLSQFSTRDIVSIFLNKKETKLYLMTTDNEVFLSTRSNKKSDFSLPSIFLRLGDEGKDFVTGMGISENEKFAIFYVEDASMKSRRIVSYLLNP